MNTQNADKIKLLCVVTMPPPEGGIRVLFSRLVRDLQKSDDVEVLLVDVGTHKKYLLKPFIILIRLIQIFFKSRRAEIATFQTPWNYVTLIGTYVYFIARMRKIPIIFRQSAGNNDQRFKRMPRIIQKFLSRTILNADLSLYETNQQVHFFRMISKNRVEWFANNRPAADGKMIPGREKAERFLFFSQVSRDKGAHIAVKAFEKLAGKYPVTLDLYGHDTMNINTLADGVPNANYRGLVKNDNAYEIFREYDVLVLPTDWAGEGHPGVLIESFMMHMPVIVSDKTPLMEIIEQDKNGLITPIGDVDAVAQAVVRLHENPDLYKSMVEHISEIKHNFTSARWSAVFIAYMRKLLDINNL